MFNFDMFSARYWHNLFRAELHGFAGFVFGILMLSALPLYIATTTLIIRTKKPLFEMPAPIKKIIDRMQPTLIEKPKTESEETTTKKIEPEPDPLPKNLPTEMRQQYIRARIHCDAFQYSSINQPAKNNIPAPVAPIPEPQQITEEIPLPTDFDIETPIENFEDISEISAPSFSDISFDDTPAPENETNNPVAEFLTNRNTDYRIQDNLIVTSTHAIATHNDEDFWVADKDFWFATGKQIPSPIQELKSTCEKDGLQGILYLGTTNIMNLDNLINEWESDGIHVITSVDQIPE